MNATFSSEFQNYEFQAQEETMCESKLHEPSNQKHCQITCSLNIPCFQ
jgi:hypothetical protein